MILCIVLGIVLGTLSAKKNSTGFLLEVLRATEINDGTTTW